jgi:hypothetical protein
MAHQFAFVLAPAALLALAGCATLEGSPTQPITVHTVDATGKPVNGMRCRIANGSADYFGNSPLLDVQIRRSGSDLEIECRSGTQIARATAFARGPSVGGMVLLPGGGAAALIDRLSGYAYAYPRAMQLRIGEHMIFDVSAPAQDSADETTDSLR